MFEGFFAVLGKNGVLATKNGLSKKCVIFWCVGYIIRG